MSKWFLRFGTLAAAAALGLMAVFLANWLVFGSYDFDFTKISKSVSPSIAQIDDFADDKAVYAAIYKDEGFDTNPKLIGDTTFRAPIDDQENPRSVPGVQLDTLTDFLEKNDESISTRPLAADIAVVGFISRAESSEIFKSGPNPLDGWKLLYKRYPDAKGILSFSRIGFNHDHTQAIVYFAQTCGRLCGKGGYLLYKKSWGTWRKAGEGTMWVS